MEECPISLLALDDLSELPFQDLLCVSLCVWLSIFLFVLLSKFFTPLESKGRYEQGPN